MSESRKEDFFRADKPEGVTAYHVAVMGVLMKLTLPSSESQESIGRKAGCSQQEVSTVFPDLVKWEWIRSKSGARHKNTNWLLEINYENLPAFVPRPKLVISQAALHMAQFYHDNWKLFAKYVSKTKGYTCTAPIPKDWKERWSAIFQLRLDGGWTETELCNRINQVIPDKKLRKALRVGPQSRKLFPVKKVVVQ